MKRFTNHWTMLVIGCVAFAVFVFALDLPHRIMQGSKAQAAIQMLDKMRRPFLDIKEAELRLLKAGNTKNIQTEELALLIEKGSKYLQEYKKLAEYNQVLSESVVKLGEVYTSWTENERDFFLHYPSYIQQSNSQVSTPNLLEDIEKVSSGFLLTMNQLGDGEHPVHEDIDDGKLANNLLQASFAFFLLYVFILVFIQERDKRRAMEDATHDHLTGLPNRKLFFDHLDLALSRTPWNKQIVAVVFIDLDDFKKTNDTMGHNVGDELLKMFAARLRESVREGDTVARLAGDEFCIILTDLAREEDIQLVIEHVHQNIAKPFRIQGKDISATCSIGISVCEDGSNDAKTLLRNADEAMYKAKKQGKNNWQINTSHQD